jgi:alkylation response protein AidB-like acyl-CoA dehydrogenase
MASLSHLAWPFFGETHAPAKYGGPGAGYATDYGVEGVFRSVRARKIREVTNDAQRRALVAEAEQNKRNSQCS